MFKNKRQLEDMRRCPFKVEYHNNSNSNILYSGRINVSFGFVNMKNVWLIQSMREYVAFVKIRINKPNN